MSCVVLIQLPWRVRAIDMATVFVMDVVFGAWPLLLAIRAMRKSVAGVMST